MVYIKNSKHLEEINDRIIDLESFENRVDIITNLGTSENEADKIRRGLDELKIMKMDVKKNYKK